MKPNVLEIPVSQASEDLGLILNGLADDTEQEQTFALALVVVTVLAGGLLVGIGLYLSIVWGL
jgi:hypothetical protein